MWVYYTHYIYYICYNICYIVIVTIVILLLLLSLCKICEIKGTAQRRKNRACPDTKTKKLERDVVQRHKHVIGNIYICN